MRSRHLYIGLAIGAVLTFGAPALRAISLETYGGSSACNNGAPIEVCVYLNQYAQAFDSTSGPGGYSYTYISADMGRMLGVDAAPAIPPSVSHTDQQSSNYYVYLYSCAPGRPCTSVYQSGAIPDGAFTFDPVTGEWSLMLTTSNGCVVDVTWTPAMLPTLNAGQSVDPNVVTAGAVAGYRRAALARGTACDTAIDIDDAETGVRTDVAAKADRERLIPA